MATVINGTTGVDKVQDNTITSAKITSDAVTGDKVASGTIAYGDMVGTDIPMIGVGQTWQNVTASRTVNTTYTNTTGKPIYVSLETVEGRDWTTSSATVHVDGVLVSSGSSYRANSDNIGTAKATAIVPNGSTYMYGWESGIDIVQRIFELR